MKTRAKHFWAVLALSIAGAGAASAQGSPHEGPLALQVETMGIPLDEGAVRQAIIRELALESARTDAPPVSVALRVVSGGELTVTIVDDAGRDLSRSVAAPAHAEEVPEVTALLVGNLARDEAGGLLARLRGAEPEPEAPVSSAPPAAEPEPERQLPLDSVNLSLFHPMALRERADERRFALELTLFYGRIGALSGFALAAGGVTSVVGDASGAMIGGLGYVYGGRGEGAMIGGLLGVGGGLSGVSVAGAASVERGAVYGGQIAGVVNVAVGELEGAQVAGAVNVSGDVAGLQTAGVLNLARGDVEGAQLGAVSIADHIDGAQISLLNIGGDVHGTQIGLVNVARDVSGAQLGLVNVAREVKGVSLGVVPYSSRGRTQVATWYNTSLPFNVGVRFHTGAIYVMPTFGYDPRGNEEIIASIDGDYAPGVSLGYRLGLGRAFVDLDVNSTNQSRGADYGENDLDLRYRLLGGLELTPAFGLFAGGGLRHSIDTEGVERSSVDPEFSVGIQLL